MCFFDRLFCVYVNSILPVPRASRLPTSIQWHHTINIHKVCIAVNHLYTYYWVCFVLFRFVWFLIVWFGLPIYLEWSQDMNIFYVFWRLFAKQYFFLFPWLLICDYWSIEVSVSVTYIKAIIKVCLNQKKRLWFQNLLFYWLVNCKQMFVFFAVYESIGNGWPVEVKTHLSSGKTAWGLAKVR